MIVMTILICTKLFRLVMSLENSDPLGPLEITQQTTVNSSLSMEGILIVWFSFNDELTMVPIELTNYAICYFNEQACIDFITSNVHETIFLITSISSATSILPNTHEMRQLDSIFLIPDQSEKISEDLFERYSKIIGIYSQSSLLFESIKENVTLASKQSETFKFYDQKQKSTRDLSKESATFLWSKLFRDIFVELPLDKYARTDMVCKLKEYYHNNNKQLKLINEFDRNYKSEDALQWYTDQPFIYKQLNRALRTENIEQLHAFRYFVADLCSSITKEHELVKEFIDNIVLYRGLTMSSIEFEKLKDNVGKLISMNGFLSTSRSKNVAKVFAGKSIEDKQCILFEIECNVEELQDAIAFADIARFSKYPEEEEILFDLGATFEILSLKKEESVDYWLVNLKATNTGEKISHEYIQSNRREMVGTSCEIAYASLLADMGKYTQAQKVYERLIHDDSGEDQARIFHGIGTIYSAKRDFDKAIQNLSHAYRLMINTDPQRVEESTVVLNSLGNVFTAKGEYDKAFIHFLEALMNRRRLFGDQFFNMDGDIFCNMGTAHFLEGKDYNLALDYYLKAFDIQETCYPSNHAILANALHNIANCYVKKQDYHQALKYFNDSLSIKKQILPPEHIDLAATLTNIGTVYYKMGKIDESFSYFTKSLKIYETAFPKGHPDTSICLTSIAHFYYSHNNYDEALEYFEKALEMNELFLPIINSDIAGNLINIANVLADQNKQEEAFVYRKLSLFIEEKLHPNGSITIMKNLSKIAEMHFEKGDYPQSIAYSLKKLIVVKCLCSDQVDSITTANALCNIGMAFMMMGKIDLSLAYHIRALHRRYKIFPDGDSSLCVSLTHTANLYHLKEQHTLALQYYEEAFIMYQKLFPDTYQINHHVGEIFFNISNIHLINNDLHLAQQFAEKALHIFRSTTVPEHHGRRTAEENIVKIIQRLKEQT